MELVALYIRTSSLANAEGDSHARQEIACREYAKNHKMKPVIMGIDDGVSGGDHIHTRKGLMDLIGACQERGIIKILCEDVSRFSRDMMVQETAYRSLIDKGIQVIPVKTPELFSIEADPSRTLIRQVMGAFFEFEKNSLVAKLRGARERIRQSGRKCEGRKSLVERYGTELSDKIRVLNRKGLSLRQISKQLFKEGVETEYGNPLQPTQINNILKSNARSVKVQRSSRGDTNSSKGDS
tara:strand:- start:501 stop:1217 length:717 start_codon:yes stop_codon:yes gene_type:complete